MLASSLENKLLSQFTSDLQAEHFIMSVSKAPSLHMTTDEDMGRREYEDHYLRYPDIFKYVELIREPAAEFLGTMVLIILGIGVDCQTGLSNSTNVAPPFLRNSELSTNLGWAGAVAMGVFIASVAGAGHCNPALTLGLATWRGFPWRKVPGYIAAQTFGAFVGTAIVYGNNVRAVDAFEGGKGIRTMTTAAFFSSYPLDYMSNAGCFFTEFIATCVIFIGLLAIVDKRIGQTAVGFVPMMLFVLVLSVGTGLGLQTNYAVNPARDLGSRMLAALVGYGSQVFSFRGQYWLWCPMIATILGAQVGGLIYDACLFTGEYTAPRPLPTPSPPIPHKLKFDTYRSDRTQSVRPDSHVYDLDHNIMSSAV